MKLFPFFLSSFFFVGLATPVFAAGSVEAGKAKAAPCEACHEKKDGSPPLDSTYPRLAGQYADYLVHALEQYRSGERKNPIMNAMIREQLKLTSQDVADLAAYYSSLPGKLNDLPESSHSKK